MLESLVDERAIRARGQGAPTSYSHAMARRRNAEIGVEGRSGTSDSGVIVHYYNAKAARD